MSQPNPYTWRLPVTDETFFGRREQIWSICEGLKQDLPRSFGIVGGPKMGRTSLWFQARSQLKQDRPDELLEIYLDADTIPLHTTEAVLRFIGEKIVARLKDKIDPQEGMKRVSEEGSYIVGIASLLRQMEEQASGTKVILVLDRADQLLKMEDWQELSRRLSYLLGSFEAPKNFALILIGTARLFQSINVASSPLSMYLFNLRLQNLELEEARRLIQAPIGGKASEVIVQRILEETDGHPFLTQYIMAELFVRTNGEIENGTPAMVEEAVTAFYHGYGDLLKVWFERLSPLAREMYGHFQEKDKREWEEEKIKNMPLRIEEGSSWAKIWDIEAALRELNTSGFIREKLSPTRVYQLSGSLFSNYYEKNIKHFTHYQSRVDNFNTSASKKRASNLSDQHIRSLTQQRSSEAESSLNSQPEDTFFTWLHLSDLHIGFKRGARDWDALSKALLRDLGEHQTIAAMKDQRLAGVQFKPNAIFLTGDIAYKGSKQEYEKAEQLLKHIWQITKLGPQETYLVPGNHDVERGKIQSIVSQELIYQALADTHLELREWREKLEKYWGSPELKNLQKTKFRNYISFARRCSASSNLYYAHSIFVNDIRLGILGLNSAVISWKDGEDRERGLWIGRPQADEVVGFLPVDTAFTIGLVHHPWEAIHELDSAWEFFQKKCNILLSGHLHKLRVIRYDEPEHGHYWLHAGSVFQDGIWQSQRYSYGQINLKSGVLDVWSRMTKPGEDPIYVRDTLTYPEKHADGHIRIQLSTNMGS